MSKIENLFTTKRVIDNQFFDLKLFAKPFATILKVNGVTKTEGVDYTTINGGLYALKIKVLPDVDGSLNNKYFLLRHMEGTEAFFVWYNVAGQGSELVPFEHVNCTISPDRAASTDARGVEVKLNSNDNALEVAQKTAKAIKSKIPEYYICDTPADPDAFDNGMGDVNGHQVSWLRLYRDGTSATRRSGINHFEDKPTTRCFGSLGTVPFELDFIQNPEKKTRIVFPAWATMSTRKIMGTTKSGSTKVFVEKDFHYPHIRLPIGMMVSGTGIPSGATIANNLVNKAVQPLVKIAASKDFSFTAVPDLSNVGNYSRYSGVVPGGSGVLSYVHSSVTFVVTAATATKGDVYSNNSKQFVVSESIDGALALTCSSNGAPQASGTLTRVSGSGDATITFSSFTFSAVAKSSNLFCRDAGTAGVNNIPGAGNFIVSEAAFLLSAPATADGTIEMTLSWPGSLVEGDQIVVEYEIGQMNFDATTQIMQDVAFNGAQATLRNTDNLWLKNVSSRIPMSYRVGGDLNSKNVLVIANGGQVSSTFMFDFLCNEYGLDAKIIAPDIAGGQNNTMDMGVCPTGPGSLSAITNDSIESALTNSNQVRALIDFIEKLKTPNKVFLSSYSASGLISAEVARYRPDLLRGVIHCDPQNQPDSLTAGFAIEYPTLLGGASPYSLANMQAILQRCNDNRVKYREIYEGSGTFGTTGQYASMNSYLRANEAVRYGGDTTGACALVGLSGGVGCIKHGATAGATDPRHTAVRQGSGFQFTTGRPAVPSPTLAALAANKVPHLILAGTTGLMFSTGKLLAYVYGLQQGTAPVTVIQGVGHPGWYGIIPQMATFMATY
jgi:pimeloyl-ACP methyl ester carboxylesterase